MPLKRVVFSFLIGTFTQWVQQGPSVQVLWYRYKFGFPDKNFPKPLKSGTSTHLWCLAISYLNEYAESIVIESRYSSDIYSSNMFANIFLFIEWDD